MIIGGILLMNITLNATTILEIRVTNYSTAILNKLDYLSHATMVKKAAKKCTAH